MFEPEAIELRFEKVLRMQGYKDLSRVHPEILSTAEAMTTLAQKEFKPVVYFKRVQVKDISSDALTLETGVRFQSRAFEHYIPDCDEIAVFIMTLGSALDETEREMAKSDRLIEAVFLETAGWLGIEQLTKLFSTFLRNVVSPDGLRPGRRMSPGYSFRVGAAKCEWHLQDQKLIFELLDNSKLSVSLLDSCAMSPKMSRSGLYGLPQKSKSARKRSADTKLPSC